MTDATTPEQPPRCSFGVAYCSDDHYDAHKAEAETQARPAVASEGLLRAALERLDREWSERNTSLPENTFDVHPMLRRFIGAARTALASDAGRSVGARADDQITLGDGSPGDNITLPPALASDAGRSVGALDAWALLEEAADALNFAHGALIGNRAMPEVAAKAAKMNAAIAKHDAERQGES